MTVDDIEGFALKLADGATVLFPEVKPFVAVLEMLLDVADEYGIIPHELSVEQGQAIAAGMAAARASAVTSYRAHAKPWPPA